MPTIGQGLASLGDDIGNAMLQYHQEHKKYDEALGFADALSRIGIDKRTGQPVQIQYDEKGKILDKENIQTFADPKALDQYRQFNRREAARNMGALDAYTRLGVNFMARAQAAAIEDASLSGQATRLRMQQAEQAFPVEQRQRKASAERTEQIIQQEKEQADKVYVPGFGFMTPAQLSTHNARIERLKTLQQKADPLIKFENELQTNYGLRMADVIDATKGKFKGKDKAGKDVEYQGVPFVNLAGEQVGADQATLKLNNYKPKAPTVFAVVGPNQARIPAHEWPQVVSKSKNFQDQLKGLQDEQAKIATDNQQLQAQQIMATIKQKDPNALTAEDQAAFQWAQGVLGQ